MAIKKLCPFKLWTLQNFPFIAEDFDALTNYEMMCKIVGYLNNVIDITNNQTDAINSLYNWFENLDVQDEIDNKLDEMVEDGTLQEIITSYLEIAGVLGYDTLADLKNATNAIDGSIARTLGTLDINDGVGSFYKIRTLTNDDVVDDIKIVALSNYPTLIAEKIFNEYEEKVKNLNIINVKDFGAVGDGVNDDSQSFQDAIDYIASQKISYTNISTICTQPTLYIPFGKYNVNNVTLKGEYIHIVGEFPFLMGTNTIFTTEANTNNAHCITIEDINFIGGETHLNLDTNNLDHSQIVLKNCKFWNSSDYSLIIDNTSCLFSAENCYFYHNKYVANFVSNDKTVFDKCWFSQNWFTAANSSHINYSGNDLSIIHSMIIPAGANDDAVTSGCSFIKLNSGSCYINDCRMSNEPNFVTLINNYVGGTNNNDIMGTIEINGNRCASSSTQPLIRLYNMPSQIKILNNKFNTINTSLLSFTDTYTYSDFATSCARNQTNETRVVLSNDYNVLLSYGRIVIKGNVFRNKEAFTDYPRELIGITDADIHIPQSFDNSGNALVGNYIMRATPFNTFQYSIPVKMFITSTYSGNNASRTYIYGHLIISQDGTKLYAKFKPIIEDSETTITYVVTINETNTDNISVTTTQIPYYFKINVALQDDTINTSHSVYYTYSN